MGDVETVVFEIIAQQAKVEFCELRRTTEISSLNLASLDIVEIMFAIEEKFDVSLLYNANQGSATGGRFETVGEVVDFVAQQVNRPVGHKT